MGGGQGGSERRIEVFVKIQKKKKNFFFFFWGGGGVGWGVEDGCERRIEIFVKIKKKKKWGVRGEVGVRGRLGGGVRMDVNNGLRFL